MILKFTFLHKHSNKDYFLKIMQNTATELDLKHNDMILGDELLFFINGEENNLDLFASKITNRLPLSLYFIFKSVEVSKEMSKNYYLDLDKPTLSFDFDLNETMCIKNIKGEHFCDIFTYPKNKINFDIFFQNEKISSKEQLNKSLLDITKMLQNKEKARIQTTKGEIVLSLDNSNFDLVLSNDISTINFYTRADKNELDALATFEKPLINLNIKDVFIDELGFSEALFILPYDPILYALSSILIDSEIPFLFLKYNDSNAKDGIYYENPFKDNFFEIILGENGYFIEKKIATYSPKDLEKIHGFIESNFKQNNKLFLIYAGFVKQTILKILDSNDILKINFDINPKNILNHLSLLPNGKKLIENYQKYFNERFEFIMNNFDNKEIFTNNILDILSPISVILGLSDTLKKDKILECANLFLRDIGPKIDFKTVNIDEQINYDYLSSVSSVISFLLAGTDNETLSYGIFESLADFFINIINDVNTNYGIKDVGIVGDLFANKIFFKKITKKIPQDIFLHFPNYIDYVIE